MSRPARADWVLETVDSTSWNAAPSLAIDADGNPHVAYVSAGALKYGEHAGGSWQTETVPVLPVSGCVPSLALDSEGRPHIAYLGYIGSAHGVCYAHWTGTTWQTSLVAAGGLSTEYPALALTAADEPRIAYMSHGDSGDTLWYASPSGTSWSSEHVCGSGYGCCGFVPSLALDANGDPRIGWGYGGYLVYAWPGRAYPWPAEWIGQNVDQYSASLVLDTADQPHAVFVKQLVDGRWLTYGARVGGVWSFEAVTSWAARSRLAFDANDRPHIAYAESSWENAGPLKYAHRTTSAWCIQTVDGANVSYLAIAVDPDGHPQIAYIASVGSETHLKCARWVPSIVTGDLNCDGCVGFGDINPFVLYLANFETWQATYPNCPAPNGDINGDGTYPSFRDINPFVTLMSGPP
ncbi:MAG: hypothetical protein KA383_08710 [Phycisphaerae bacterium]|nr:hypothetical protein [Phycisphaerae bacterium]